MTTREESNLPKDTQRGSRKNGRTALLFLEPHIPPLVHRTRHPHKEMRLCLGSREETKPLDPEWSAVLGIGLYQHPEMPVPARGITGL